MFTFYAYTLFLICKVIWVALAWTVNKYNLKNIFEPCGKRTETESKIFIFFWIIYLKLKISDPLGQMQQRHQQKPKVVFYLCLTLGGANGCWFMLSGSTTMQIPQVILVNCRNSLYIFIYLLDLY